MFFGTSYVRLRTMVRCMSDVSHRPLYVEQWYVRRKGYVIHKSYLRCHGYSCFSVCYDMALQWILMFLVFVVILSCHGNSWGTVWGCIATVTHGVVFVMIGRCHG